MKDRRCVRNARTSEAMAKQGNTINVSTSGIRREILPDKGAKYARLVKKAGVERYSGLLFEGSTSRVVLLLEPPILAVAPLYFDPVA
jgi:hypothetical protein